MRFANIHTLIQTSRPNFLILAISAVAFSVGLACLDGVEWHFTTVFLILLAALLAHVAVNMHNEYCDHKSQLDFVTNRTPFSGGSGALQDNGKAEALVLLGALLALGLASAIGVYFIVNSSNPIFLAVLGIVSILVLLLYTPILNRFPLLCLLAPGFGFGGSIVVGSYVVLTGFVTTNILLAGVLMAVLANNLLLLNQVPDAEADKAHGRRHWVICHGLKSSARVYLCQWLIGLLVIISLSIFNSLSFWVMLALIPYGFGFAVTVNFLSLASADQLKHSTMAMNVVCAVVTPALLGIILCVDV